MSISDWSSDVCSSDLEGEAHGAQSDPPLSPALRAELMAEAGRNGCIASLIDDTENRCRAYLSGFMSWKVASPDDPTRAEEAVVELVLATWRGLLAREIGRATVRTPVTNAQHVLRFLIRNKNTHIYTNI